MQKSPHTHLKFKIAVSGAAETGHCAPNALEITKELGREIARHNSVLVTGATTGSPFWAAIGAKEVGGIVIGLSPAHNEFDHVKTYNLPVDYHDLIIYTGFEYGGRNLLLTRSADAVIVLCGRIGTLNEFTITFEEKKPIGVLEGTGGIADMLREIVEKAHRGSGKLVFSKDPSDLVDKVLALIKADEKGNGLR